MQKHQKFIIAVENIKSMPLYLELDLVLLLRLCIDTTIWSLKSVLPELIKCYYIWINLYSLQLLLNHGVEIPTTGFANSPWILMIW
jgi:hypothetical protein